MKHSPAPWTFDPDVGGCRSIRCNRPETEPEGCDNEVCVTPGLADDDEDYANASLIIAAPDMLEALKDARCHLEAIGGCTSVTRRINKAISKAETQP